MTLLVTIRIKVTEKFKCFKLSMQRALDYVVFALNCLYHPFLCYLIANENNHLGKAILQNYSCISKTISYTGKRL